MDYLDQNGGRRLLANQLTTWLPLNSLSRRIDRLYANLQSFCDDIANLQRTAIRIDQGVVGEALVNKQLVNPELIEHEPCIFFLFCEQILQLRLAGRFLFLDYLSARLRFRLRVAFLGTVGQ